MVCSVVSITFDSPRLGKQNKIYKILEYWSRDMLNFVFLEKSLGTVSPPNFVYGFSKKMFLIYTLLTDQISLPDCRYFLRYW